MKLVGILLSIVLVGFGVWIGILTPITYAGKEVFRSESEYLAFKEAVSNPGVHINDMAVLSSEPPIIVKFSVGVERGEDFPYGKGFIGWNAAGGIGVVVMGLFTLLLGLSVKRENDEVNTIPQKN